MSSALCFLGAPFAFVATQIKWNTKNQPAVCPMKKIGQFVLLKLKRKASESSHKNKFDECNYSEGNIDEKWIMWLHIEKISFKQRQRSKFCVGWDLCEHRCPSGVIVIEFGEMRAKVTEKFQRIDDGVIEHSRTFVIYRIINTHQLTQQRNTLNFDTLLRFCFVFKSEILSCNFIGAAIKLSWQLPTEFRRRIK